MDSGIAATSIDEADWVAIQRGWARGWRRLVLSAAFLAYLIYVGNAVAQLNHGAPAVAGYVVLGVFIASYLGIIVQPLRPSTSPFWTSKEFWALYGLMVASFVAELPFARATSFVMCLYITSITVARLGRRAAPIVVVLALGALLLPVAIPSWHDSLSTAFNNVAPLAIPVVAIVTYGVVRIQRGNQALADARAEVVRLSAESERSRIARDLHDLLGHSLTTITLKAGLARRLRATDPERASREITEVEELSRRALTEVRAAVSGYREVTVAGELVRGRELLRASGVAADLPTAADVVDAAHQELFGWAIREGLTNVARHARATTCTITLTASEVEIRDNGVGCRPSCGNGIDGLRERAAAAGGVVEAGPLDPRGWRLRVTIGPAASAPL